MLRDELLRSKNDEIAKCLLSRKRKLTELYYATVGFESATADALYSQKEQAFLEANDLTRGRYFDESTLPLPSFPRSQSPTRSAVASNTNNDVKTLQSDTGPSTASTASVSPTQGACGIAPPPPIPDSKANAHLSPTSTHLTATLQLSSNAPTSTTHVGFDPYGSSVSDPRSEGRPLTVIDKGDKVLTNPAKSHEPTDADVLPSLAIPARQASRKRSDARPLLTLGPSNGEQPVSPASSIDPYSTNTPIAVAASPDTSPGEEIGDARKLDARSAHDVRSVPPRPTTIPSTPDEQLRLEEAQSIYRATVDSVQGARETMSKDVARPDIVKQTVDLEQGSSIPRLAQSTSTSTKPIAAEGDVLSPQEQNINEDSAREISTEVTKPIAVLSAQPDVSQQRMTTRVSSGAIRHKSVSEILGEVPRQVNHDKPPAKPEPQTPESLARMRFKDRKIREKERSRVSTVVFPKQASSLPMKSDATDLVSQEPVDAVAKLNEEQDYLFTLFLNRAYAPPRGTNLNTLLASAHKTLSTANHLLEYQEQMDCRTLRRIYALQNANRWPLRQMKRSAEPHRSASHRDVLLDHMKWMRIDFREERKWKLAAAKSCAEWCAEYVNSDEEHRLLLRVDVKRHSSNAIASDTSKPCLPSSSGFVRDNTPTASHPTPDLVPSTEEESVSDGFNEEHRQDLQTTVAPAAIFSLGSDEFNFSLDMTPSAEKILDELPLFEPVRFKFGTQDLAFKDHPDSLWKLELLPVTKFASTKITFQKDAEHHRKETRYDYSKYVAPSGNSSVADLPPEQTNVALFRPENKTIRDRIHPGHSFRPPTEHPMPSVGFFESRQSSQWTATEDEELRRLVKEYTYNWSLVSSCLTPPSLFTSGAERRTPWECFERWVGLEGLPADMMKTQYFRVYHQRLESAQRTVLAQQQAAQQQQQQQAASNGQQPQPIRRRTTQPLRVDRRRSSKHLALLDAMRKLAKKRETILQKQQHASQLASLRKANEASQPKPPISSPAEFSRLKHERETKLNERQEQYRQQMMAQQRASLAAQRVGQLPNQPQQQAPQMMNGPGRPGNLPPNMQNTGMANSMPNGIPSGMPGNVALNQARAQPLQGVPVGATPLNGQVPASAMHLKMLPQGQLANVASRSGMQMQASPENARVIREANRVQEQQRLLQSRQQQIPQSQVQGQQAPQQFHTQQFAPQGGPSPNINMSGVNGASSNPAMIAALQAQAGIQSPSLHSGTPQGVSSPTPRLAQPSTLAGGGNTISAFQTQLQRAHPNMSAEQVNKLATEHLNQYQQQRLSQQAAMNATGGGMSNAQAKFSAPHDSKFQGPQQVALPNGGAAMQVPQNQGFSPMMRVPQSTPQNRANVTSSPVVNGSAPQPSRSATPQTQRSGSAQAGAVSGQNRSPHPTPAQTTST
ncbi:Chromatin modification-related eaf1-like protein [Penicillium ucsense]|uniref:Vacuolar import and degradation protein 21 n=1 Tax=Penicillium ucsense TaxID=2839758 RepID=A0A8J8W7U7_9EURO|nr:Chromatin modification-related eaf1-like protein [Penicillium ucsense]KAF7735398.1 Chromatin modification-related eaf1-like protein [Penicillium ucsense]